MRRLAPLALAAVLGLACAIFMSACGGDSDGLLSQSQADEINRQLDEIEAAANAGDCDQAGSLAAELALAIQKNKSVDSKLKASLTDSLEWIQSQENIPGFCEGTAETTSSETESDTTSTEEVTTEEETTSDEAPPPDTVESTPDTTASTPTGTTGGTPGGTGGITP